MASISATARIRAICLELPEATEKPFGGHTSPAFRIRDKMFVVLSEDQTSMTAKADKGVQEILVNSDPERFFVPKYVGSKGWVGVRLDLATQPDWARWQRSSMRATASWRPRASSTSGWRAKRHDIGA
jgi:hypothetical protein